ncbi:MAG: RimK family alpha-L-glutamate ligase [Gallionellaceae bacterium]|nr:MAG: RimK family alpha-L-glutamate ligase [Gallionellaceae bacterium]
MTEKTFTAAHATPPLIGLAALMRMVFAGADLKPLAAELSARAERDPHDANALLDLSTILQLNFQHAIAMQVQTEALNTQRIYSIPAAKQPAKLRLLAMMGAGDLLSNTPLECLLEDSDIELDMIYVASFLPFPESVPDHDVLFVAVGESDENIPLLQELADIQSVWPRPVLNSPARIALLQRDSTCAMLGDAPGALMPVAVRVSRDTLAGIAAQRCGLGGVLARGDFPVIIRPVDSHAGRGLARIGRADELQGYLLAMSENEFYISPFIDYRSADGQFRKYRIVLIEGHPHICHLAISSHWMIHYLNAGMAESAQKRAEEERCFADFDTEFAQRHARALQAIYERMGLDYLGIDCAETSAGELLIFEVDSNMVVHALDPVDIFPYKQTQMQKIFAAFRALLVKSAGKDGGTR